MGSSIPSSSPVSVNPASANVTNTNRGSDFSWAIFAVAALVFLGVSGMTMFSTKRGNRTFNYLVAAALACNALNWYAIASNLGAVPVTVEFRSGSWTGHGNGIDNKATRSVWVSRYIDWLFSTPFILLSILLASPVPLSTIFMTIFIETVVVAVAFFGALTPSSYKWGWFVLGVCGLTWVYWTLFGPGLLAAKRSGKDVFWGYLPMSVAFGVFGIVHVIAWGVSTGGNNIAPDSEQVYYGILDLLGKHFLLPYHIYNLSGIDYERFGLFSAKASLFADASHAPGQALPESGKATEEA